MLKLLLKEDIKHPKAQKKAINNTKPKYEAKMFNQSRLSQKEE
jgi:hypothetical protein